MVLSPRALFLRRPKPRPIATRQQQLASVKQQLRSLETAHPELRESRDGLEEELKTLVAANPDLRSERHASDAFAPPKLHHINVVSREVTGLLEFYRDVLRMDEMPIEMFPRTGMTAAGAGSNHLTQNIFLIFFINGTWHGHS